MAQPTSDLLRQEATYSDQSLTLRGLEDTIRTQRGRQNDRVQELATLRGRNEELQQALSMEVGKLRQLSEQLARRKQDKGFWAGMKGLLSKLPGLGGLSVSPHSIEDLLRRQYETSTLRLKEASEFADRLESIEAELYDEINRLNDRIVSSARDEETAAEYLMLVKDLYARLEVDHASAEPSSAQARELQAELDHCRRIIAQHTSKLRLFGTAEERIARLKEATHKLAETIANLRTDISQYVYAAGEKLDLAAGQIQAVGAAADASLVMLELKRSLDAMTESLNVTTRFVSETQVYFRENLDHLVDDLEIYDDETREVLDQNLAISEALQEQQVSDAVTEAMFRELELRAERKASVAAASRAEMPAIAQAEVGVGVPR